MPTNFETWHTFFEQVLGCEVCAKWGMINVLRETAGTPWGLAWYDRHANPDGGVMMVGMDFGNADSVARQRQQLAADPDFEPGFSGPGEDKSYARLRRFLLGARLSSGEPLANRVYLSNAALCARPAGADECGEYEHPEVYQACARHLATQINLTKPYVVVALGATALQAVCRVLGARGYDGRIIRDVGHAIHVPVNDATVTIIPFLHPSRGQPGWSDVRQQHELYQALAYRLDDRLAATPRAVFRQQFGDWSPAIPID